MVVGQPNRPKMVKIDNKRKIDKICPKCNNNKMWIARGSSNPNYGFKCCKCGFKIGGFNVTQNKNN